MGGVAVAVATGALVVAPRSSELPGAAAAASEREVVAVDVVAGGDGPVFLNAVLARANATLARTGRTATTTSTSRAASVSGRLVAAPVAARPLVRPGDHGVAITYVQKRLRVKPSGFYGPATFAAVVAFQKARALPAQGIVGPRTWVALLTPAAPARAKVATRSTTAPAAASPARRTSTAPVSAGRVCPAPGAAFGDGWGVARSGHRHQGVDLAGRRGMPIRAIEDGVIVREGRQGNGALRIVQQGVSGSKFYYGHMSRDLVHAGSRVKRGQVIGLMGDSGSPGAVHLHFEYWRSGGESAAVDAGPLLRRLC
jgi:murein DD-endopeptidase MepM/ murein hydrolase activator NlpD